MIISVMGSDGSGKSSISKRICADYLSLGKKVKYQPEFNGLLINILKNIAGRGTRKKDIGGSLSEKQSSSKIAPYIVWLDQNITYLHYKIFLRDHIIIQDRGYIDHLITWKELGNYNGFVKFIYDKILLKPDLAFVVLVSAEDAHKRRSMQDDGRKPKSIDFYKTKMVHYSLIEDGKGVVKIVNKNFGNTVSRTEKYINHREKLLRVNTIAVSGLDGAGKSTLISLLKDYAVLLNVPMRTQHFYYNYIIMKIIKGIRKPRVTEDAVLYQKSIEIEKNHRGSGKSILWTIFVIVDAFLQYYFTRLSGLGRLVVFDRYFYDYFVSFDFINAPYDENILKALTPSVDRYFLLVGDTDILYERKPEHTKEFFEECKEKYSAFSYISGVKFIDTTKNNPQQTLDRVMEDL